jgi:Exonuclease
MASQQDQCSNALSVDSMQSSLQLNRGGNSENQLLLAPTMSRTSVLHSSNVISSAKGDFGKQQQFIETQNRRSLTNASHVINNSYPPPVAHRPLSKSRFIAMDCEMVGVGPRKVSVLARVSIVNFNGDCIFDVFVKVEEKVTDYRTAVSGIRPEDLESSSAMSYGEVRLKGALSHYNGCP